MDTQRACFGQRCPRTRLDGQAFESGQFAYKLDAREGYGPRRNRTVSHLRTHQQSWLESVVEGVDRHTRTRSYIFRPWRVISTAVENFFSNDDLLRASALTYTSTLSIVPVLAVAFSALERPGSIEQLRRWSSAISHWGPTPLPKS